MRVGAETKIYADTSIIDSHRQRYRLDELFLEVKFSYHIEDKILRSIYGKRGEYCVWVDPVAKHGKGNWHVNENRVRTKGGRLKFVTVSLIASDRSRHSGSTAASETFKVSSSGDPRKFYVTKNGRIHDEKKSDEYVLSVRILEVSSK